MEWRIGEFALDLRSLRPNRVRSLTIPCLVSAFFLASCNQPAPKFDAADALHPNVSGEKALAHVEAIVNIGPRPSGSEGAEKNRVYLEEELAKLGWQVQRQTFSTKTPQGPMEFTNMLARFGDGPSNALFEKGIDGILCSHYDTKKFDGFEFVGANDAGSSTGLLIELARVLAEKPKVASRLELVFFDGEEALGTSITEKDGLYGSKYYAKEQVIIPKKNRPKWGVLLDMVGDKDLNVRAGIQIPGLPLRAMPDPEFPEHKVDLAVVRASLDTMAKWLLQSAGELEYRKHFGISPNYITDDHVPLNIAAGIPTIDIIDFDYDYWHTPGDTLDKLSAESLGISGKVTLLLVEKYLLPAKW